MTSYTVSEVARLAGVTVRALHHYDEIGLLSAGQRSPAGYRRYGDAELERLQQICYYRELGFTLDEIGTILDDPGAEAETHLLRQHHLVTERIERLQHMAAAIELALEAHKMGIKLTPAEKLEIFGDHDPDDYAEEAKQRWGDTEAYAESAKRTAEYTKQDWQRFHAEGRAWGQQISALMESGAAADSEAAMELAEQHRQQISTWFYECSYEIHTGLADMYLADERFTAYYEKIMPGLARYLHDAIHANAVTRA